MKIKLKDKYNSLIPCCMYCKKSRLVLSDLARCTEKNLWKPYSDVCESFEWNIDYIDYENDEA